MKRIGLIGGIGLLAFIGIIGCQGGSSSADPAQGKVLAEQYCQGCHLFPEPASLPKATWEYYVLPRMGYMYGIFPDKETRESLFEANAGGDIVRKAGIFPAKRVLDEETWAAIQAYYLAEAPAALPKGGQDSVSSALQQFEAEFPDVFLSPPSTTLAQFSSTNRLYIGDANKESLLQFDDQGNTVAQAKLKQGPVGLTDFPDQIWTTVMGSFSPTDAPSGMIVALPKGQGGVAIPIDSLQRPVHSSYGDLNQDGLLDVVVCEFGKWTGRLAWHENKGDGTFEAHTLLPKPGATKAYIQDMNGDSLPDIVALFGQSDEGIDIYYNKGKGSFGRERVLRFPPTYGSSFMDLRDLNGDGHLDIVYTAGDNADYRPVLKPYHGIYFFLNDGQNHFQQTFFYPLHGAYGAEVYDFDEDGDLDIAAISFFPDYTTGAKESFVYLENEGQFQMKAAQTFPKADLGRWLIMEAGDYNGDGDIDLVLGSLTFEVVPESGYMEKWVTNGIPYVILQNQLR